MPSSCKDDAPLFVQSAGTRRQREEKHREQPSAQRANDLEGGTFAGALSLTSERHWSRVWKRDKRRTERLDAAQSFPGSKAAGLRCQLGFPWARAPETRQVPWNCTRCAVQLLKQEEASTTASKYCAPFKKSCRRRGRDVSFEEICSWPLIGFDERSGLTPPPRERD